MLHARQTLNHIARGAWALVLLMCESTMSSSAGENILEFQMQKVARLCHLLSFFKSEET